MSDESRQPYVVFSKRDILYERRHNYSLLGIELYDRFKSFDDLLDAKKYAVQQFPAVLLNRNGVLDSPQEQTYLLAVRPDGKYVHTDYGGGRDILPSWDMRRVARTDLESTLQKLHKDEHAPCGYMLGVEEKLF